MTACSPPATDPGGGEAGTGTIIVGMNSGLVPQFEAYAEVYNAIDPEFQIELQPIPDAPADYIQQLVTQSLSSELPDVIFNYDSLNQQLAGSDLLFDLRPWLEEGKEGLSRDKFIPAFLDQYIADMETGAIGGLPVSADSTMLFYNKTMFETAGVTELPTEDWTWKDLYDVARQISTAGAGQYWGLRTPLQSGDLNFVNYPFLNANGSSIYDGTAFNFADDAGLETWEVLMQPYIEGFGTPFPDGTDTIDHFSASLAAMTLDTRPAIARYRDTLKDDWDVINLPTLNGNPVVGGGSYGLSISEKSENKDAAWKFLAWFYSTDGGMKEAEPNGVIPATADGLANGVWRTDDNPIPSNLLPATEYAVENAALPPAIPNEAAADLGAALQEAAQKVLVGGESIESAYTAAEDRLNALIG